MFATVDSLLPSHVLPQAKHIVLVSFAFPVHAPHTVFGGQADQLEASVEKSGIPFTILRLPLFTDNTINYAATVKSQNKFYSATRPDAPFSTIAVSDVGDAAAVVLAQPAKHAGKKYLLASRPWTNQELAGILTKFINLPGKTVRDP